MATYAARAAAGRRTAVRSISKAHWRLKLDRVDLYQLHTPDPRVPFIESLQALAECQGAGMIRHIGLSNVSVGQLNEALRHVSLVSVQNEYNIEDRASDDVLEACMRRNIAFIPWYPLGSGSAARSAKLKQLAARRSITPAQLALAWLLARGPVVLPIPGTSSLAHLEENVAAARLRLTADEQAALA